MNIKEGLRIQTRFRMESHYFWKLDPDPVPHESENWIRIRIKVKNCLKYSGRGKFMPLPLKSKILETPGSLVTDDIKMFPF